MDIPEATQTNCRQSHRVRMQRYRQQQTSCLETVEVQLRNAKECEVFIEEEKSFASSQSIESATEIRQGIITNVDSAYTEYVMESESRMTQE